MCEECCFLLFKGDLKDDLQDHPQYHPQDQTQDHPQDDSKLYFVFVFINLSWYLEILIYSFSGNIWLMAGVY